MSYSRDNLESWLKTFNIQVDRVLDVGGAQRPIKNRVGSWDVKDYKILDLEIPHELALVPDIPCDINEPISEYLGSPVIVTNDIVLNYEFDIVFCIEVLDYVWNPVEAFKNLSFFTKKGGLLYLTAPFIYPVHKPDHEDCARFTHFGIRKLLKMSGFEIVEEHLREFSTSNIQKIWAEEGMRQLPETSKLNLQSINLIAKKL